MEVLEAAGQPGSFSGVVLVHMEVVEATGQPGSYPDMFQVHMEDVEAAGRICRPSRQVPWSKSTCRFQRLHESQTATLARSKFTWRL